MSRLMLVLGVFLTVVFGVRAQGLGDNKEGTETRGVGEQCYGCDYKYDEATIKDKVVRDFLWVFDSEKFAPNDERGSTIYDTRHGMVMTVVLLPPEKVEELYEKRLNARNVKATYDVYYGSRVFSDSKRFDGRKLDRCMFFKI